MMKKYKYSQYLKVLTISLVSLVMLAGCGASETTEEKTMESNKETPTDVSSNEEIQSKDQSLSGAQVDMGQVFTKGDLKYHVLSVRENEVNDTQLLIPKIEVFNAGTENVNYSPMETLNLVDMKNEECPLDLFAATDGTLAGTILPGNKVIGEVAFDVSRSNSDAYVIQVGEFFDDYEAAIKISMNAIDQVYDEAFESKGIDTDLSIGSTVESKQFSIEASKAILSKEHMTHKTFEAKEGRAFLIMDFKVKNNTSETQSFLTSFFINGFLENGAIIEPISMYTSIPASIEPSEIAEGQIVWDVPEGEKAFYLSVMPNLKERDAVYYVSFEVQ